MKIVRYLICISVFVVFSMTGFFANSIAYSACWCNLDSNPATIAVEADGGNLYRLHNNGQIWKYNGNGWTNLDSNPATIVIKADGGNLYQLHNGGAIYKYNGNGWDNLDSNPATMAIVADGGNLYQLHDSGAIWEYCCGTYTSPTPSGCSLIQAGQTAPLSGNYKFTLVKNTALKGIVSKGSFDPDSPANVTLISENGKVTSAIFNCSAYSNFCTEIAQDARAWTWSGSVNSWTTLVGGLINKQDNEVSVTITPYSAQEIKISWNFDANLMQVYPGQYLGVTFRGAENCP